MMSVEGVFGFGFSSLGWHHASSWPDGSGTSHSPKASSIPHLSVGSHRHQAFWYVGRPWFITPWAGVFAHTYLQKLGICVPSLLLVVAKKSPDSQLILTIRLFAEVHETLLHSIGKFGKRQLSLLSLGEDTQAATLAVLGCALPPTRKQIHRLLKMRNVDLPMQNTGVFAAKGSFCGLSKRWGQRLTGSCGRGRP